MRQPPLIISDFEFIRPIGRGSYGEVWLARSVTGIYRAIKVVYKTRFEEARPFEREFAGIQRFEPVSRAQPNLVDILHVGRKDELGCFYYVMELADAAETPGARTSDVGSPDWVQNYRPKSLREVLALRGRLTAEQSLPVAIGLTRALGHLHSNGLIHRDVKPSNVIFVNDIPKLADIGLVSAMDESHSFVGTEGFVPPEGPGTVAADIFSLGKLLYEMSAGRDRLDFPRLPEEIEHMPDRATLLELNEVVLKACHPQVGDRYSSTGELLDDLLLLQAGRSVKRLRIIEKRLARVLPLGLALLALVAGIVVFQHLRTRKAQELAQIEGRYRREAEEQGLATRQLLYAADMNLAHQAFAAGDLGRTRALLKGQIPKPGTPDLRGFEWRYYWGLSQGDQAYTFPAQAKPVAALAFSPDGHFFASAGYDNRADVWDFSNRRLVKSLPTQGAVEDVAFSSDGRDVLVSDETGCVDAREISTGRSDFHLQGKFCRMAVSPAGSLVAFGSGGKQFVLDQGPGAVWDYRSNQRLFLLPEAGTYVAFSPDGRRLASGCWNRELKVWDMKEGRLCARLAPVENNLGMSFSPDASKLATGDESGNIVLWDVETGKRIANARAHSENIFKIAISPDGQCLASVSADQTVRLWNAESLSPLAVLRGHLSEVWGVAFSPDSRNLISSGKDGTIRLWNVERSASSDVLTNDVNFWSWPVFSDDGHWVAVGEMNACVSLWRVSDGAFQGRVPGAERALAFGTNQDTLLTLGPAGELARWSIPLTNARPLRQIRLDVKNVFSHCILRRRGALITGDEKGGIALWDLDSGAALGSWSTRPARIISMAISPDEQTLATANEGDKEADLWDLTSHRLKRTLQGHSLSVYSVTFSPDGLLLATASVDDTCGLWNPSTGQRVATLGGHKGGTYSVAFSPDGKTLAVGCNEGELKLWNVHTRRDMLTLNAELHALFSTCFAPDGRAMATVSFNHRTQRCSLKLWHAPDLPQTEANPP